MRFFTSDTHFGDEKTIKRDMRPFKSAKEFDRFVLKTWNKQTTKDDTIYVLGDFISCHHNENESYPQTLPYAKKLKAKVILILGNNEERAIKYYFDNDFDKFRDFCIKSGFEDVKKSDTITINKKKFFLTHKPSGCRPDMLNLFGHLHRSGGVYRPFGFNVGCDLNHFRLYSEDDIISLTYLKKDFWDVTNEMLFDPFSQSDRKSQNS